MKTRKQIIRYLEKQGYDIREFSEVDLVNFALKEEQIEAILLNRL